MRKTIFALMVALCAFFLCTSCKCSSENQDAKLTIDAPIKIDVENAISADREYMFLNYGEGYFWYETQITLDEYLDELCCGSVASVTNVFQVSSSSDPVVIIFTHDLNGSTSKSIHSFWIEDYKLNNETIKLTSFEAFERLMQANCPKPHSKNCVLREEIGPYACNPQYIFGNINSTVYVDAVTGEVRLYSPAFDKP